MNKKQLLSLLLCLIMLVSLMPTFVLAAEDPQLVMRFFDWSSGTPVPSEEHYITSDTRSLYWGNDYFPALLVNGELISIAPEAIYSSDPTVLPVAPSTEFPGAINFTVNSMDGGELKYKHTDGKTYSFPVHVTLPDYGFYTKPEATADNLINVFNANESNDTVYLISRTDCTFDNVRLERFPAGTSFDISKDGKIVTIHLGHTSVSEQYLWAEFDIIRPDGSRWEGWNQSFTLNASFPGIYFRSPVWIENVPSESLDNPIHSNCSCWPTYGESWYCYYFDGTKEIRLHPEQIFSTNPDVISLTASPAGEDIIWMEPIRCGSADIIYTHTDGKEYKIPVECVLPDWGFFTAPEYKEDYFIPRGIEQTTGTNEIYFVLSDIYGPNVKIMSVSLDESIGPLQPFPQGSDYVIAPDGRSVAITVGNIGVERVELLFTFTIGEWTSNTNLMVYNPNYAESTPTPTPTPAPNIEFTDVSTSDWFYNPVAWAVEKGITGGLTPTSFGPNESCTRAQVVTFLYAAAGKPQINPTNNPFTDVSESDWFYAPVMWAVEQGITGGLTPTTFGPNNTCTRAQVVTFLYAAAGKPEPTGAANPFTDVSSGDWYLNPVLWAVEKGITGGLTPTTFGPNDTCTRAQVVTFLYANATK